MRWLFPLLLIGCGAETGTPAAAPYECGAACAGMVRIAPGSFVMGSPAGEGTAREHPQRKVTFAEPFWIDATEVTNAQYVAFLKARGGNTCAYEGQDYPCVECFGPSIQDLGFNCEDPDLPIKEVCQAAPGGPIDASCADHPVVLVTWAGARAYCEALGRRLPTEAEWERAANGPGEWRRFPWGDGCPAGWSDGAELSACQDGPAEPVANCLEASCGDGFAGAAPVGSFPSGASPEGVLDLAGNVLERVADCYHSSYEGDPPSDGTAWVTGCDPTLRLARSSSYLDPGAALRSRARTDDIELSVADPDVGFRCAHSEPQGDPP